ncbi:hypothetical protein AM571_PC00377 (plasmid) [Rhizobium etli 8C-3]|uniref:Uncharacterized protein n=2 Tax=Rhizobium TaxID=379 RepID=A0A4R3R797_9HYPH|nr:MULTISPECIES: hypothetical protein [Rhizobium]APO78117.1 hypothetical protein AM571_PC00377 [Rhizobium etli 8C-3]TCU31073.1 hypothetical protein EV130_101648 [Rhizobium azibense]TCU40904.1 hypothetical protein EV129_101191 [Rhizobium azibense]
MELPSIQVNHADRLFACRQKVEGAVYEIIFSERLMEFSAAEIAMAVADIADDYILSIAKQKSATHKSGGLVIELGLRRQEAP